jgi:predicted PurR-regulated permease PerM
MQSAQGFSGAARTLFVLAAFVIVVSGMRAAETLMVTFLLSCFFAIVCAPPFMYMQRKGLPAWLSLILVVIFILLMQVVFITIVTQSLGELSQNMPLYQERLRSLTGDLLNLLVGLGIEVPRATLMQQFDPSTIFKLVANALGSLGGVLSNSFLIILTVIFMLFEGASLPAKLRYAFGEHSTHMQHVQRFLDNVKKYTTIKAAISFLTGLLIYVWLLMLDVDFALLWAVVAFLFNFVPNIGSIIAAVPAVLLALIQLGPVTAMLTAAGYVVVNTVMGNIIEPRYMGRGLGLSTLVVFLSLVFWGWVLGPVGMLLSVPLTMLLKIALESSEETQWLAIMLGPEQDLVD